MPLIQQEFQNGEKCSAVPAGENLFDKALAGRDLPDLGSSRGALISLCLIVINGKHPSYRTFKRTAVELSVYRTWRIKGTAHH